MDSLQKIHFVHQNNGIITIDDVDTLKMNRDYLRKLYGMVLQESWIYKPTVKCPFKTLIAPKTPTAP